MGVLDYMKNAAMSFIAPPKKPIRNAKQIENPDAVNRFNPEAEPYQQVNRNGPDPMLRPKKTISFMHPDTTKDITKDKNGHYVSTLSYPLPPVNWEKKQYAKNRRMRNSKNNYL